MYQLTMKLQCIISTCFRQIYLYIYYTQHTNLKETIFKLMSKTFSPDNIVTN